MPAPFTPTGRLQQAVAPARPHGDPSNLGLARELLDTRALLLAVMRGFSVGDPRVTVGGDAATPALAVTKVEPAPVRDDALVWRAAGPSAGTVLPGALAASTIHYLYLRSATDGTLSYVVSTTPPTGCYRATSNELQRCVAAFATGLLGYPLPAVVRENSGRSIASSGRAERVALDNGQATAWAAVDLSALVPPSATTAWVMARVYRAAGDAGGRELQVRRSSADGGHLVAASANVGSASGSNVDTFDEKLVQVPLLNAGFEYQLNAAVTAGAPYGARFIVLGWE